MATEAEHAAALVRDHVVPLVKAKGQAHPVGPTSQIMWQAGPFRFALRTPSSPAALPVGAPDYAGAKAKVEAGRMLPNGLDIWHNDKVLSLEWDIDKLAVIRFERGPWENTVLALQ